LESASKLHRGDLFGPVGEARYDLIISIRPIRAEGMAKLPRECRRRPKLALDAAPTDLMWSAAS